MTIAFDLDRTIDQDPVMWSGIVYSMQARGHTCLLVSCRMLGPENKSVVREFLSHYDIDIPMGRVYLTSGQAKLPFMAALGVKVDLWVDDDPECILKGK